MGAQALLGGDDVSASVRHGNLVELLKAAQRTTPEAIKLLEKAGAVEHLSKDLIAQSPHRFMLKPSEVSVKIQYT